MRCIQIKNSYNIWSKAKMKELIDAETLSKYASLDPEALLNRTYNSMYIEWWLHNIGYYVTLPFCKNESCQSINTRCRDVDIEEH